MAAEIARKRLARGVKLNPQGDCPLRCSYGGCSMAARATMQYGATIVTRDDCMEGVPEMIPEVQVEATFQITQKLVTVHGDPINKENCDEILFALLILTPFYFYPERCRTCIFVLRSVPLWCC